MPVATEKDADTLISEIIPSEEVKKLEYGRTEEVLQPLLDLGYIDKASPTLMAQGIRLFRKDYLSLQLIPDFIPQFLSLPESELESEELNLLHTLTALDGDFVLETLPKIGDVNLISRIIHYRLSIHRFFVLPTDHPFSQDSLDAIKRMRVWIKNLPGDAIGLFNLLGNIPQLIQHINIDANGDLNEKIVAFKYQKIEAPSEFPTIIPKGLIEEISEDEDEDEEDNEDHMLLLETKIETQFDQLDREPIFDQKEQDALKDSRKNQRKRSKTIRLQAMLKKINEEQQKGNTEINHKRDEIKAQMAPLTDLQISFTAQKEKITKDISEKEQTKEGLETKRKRLKKKKRILKKKIKKNKPQEEIDALRQEIKNIENSASVITNLEIEISDLNRQLFPINEELTRMQSRLKSLNRNLSKLDEERQRLNSEKQAVLQPLVKRIRRLEDQVNKLKFSFRGKLKKVLDDTYYKKTVKEEIFNNRNGQVLETISLDSYNKYLIRLIQIFQWTNGYYYGKLDDQVGDRTFSALDDMVHYSKGLRIKLILTRLSKNQSGTEGYWVLNIKYLFEKLSHILKNQKSNITTKHLLEKYETLFTQDDPNTSKIGNAVTDQGYKEIVSENQSDLKKDGLARRIYYGIKNIATTLFDALDHLFVLIKKGVKHLIYLVKNLVKIVYKEIREGVRKFKDGMIFLFGKRQFITPTSSGSAILTKFDFDFDAMTYAPPGVNNRELKAHAVNLYRYSNNLEFTMVLTGKILKWVVNLSSPFGWARLAIRIAIEYKKLMIKWLIALGRKLRKKIISIKYKMD